ncbi:MAG: S8 family peptidase [Candidatus Thorarchaeota archaeon]
MNKKLMAMIAIAVVFGTVPIASSAMAYVQARSGLLDLAYIMATWSDSDPETQWGIERIFNGVYDGHIPTADVDVAILDTGIDLDHPDLMANIAWGYDAVRGRTADDGNGHGSHCAGIVGAIKNGIGVVGVYANVDLYAIKVLGPSGTGTYADIIEGIYAACKGPDGKEGTADDADVISMSLGGSTDNVDLHNAIIHAYNMGIVIVAAAGNSGDGNPSTTEISYPAAYPEVIAVGATDSSDNIASFSNSGYYVEVAAPGVSIYSTYKNGGYATLSGTSMACPHVSGLVALIIAVKGKMPVGTFSDTGTNTIRGYLHSTALDLGPAGWDPSFGYGLIQASQLI